MSSQEPARVNAGVTFNILFLVYTGIAFAVFGLAAHVHGWDLLGVLVGSAFVGGMGALLTVGLIAYRS